MTTFFWPEADLRFNPGVIHPQVQNESLYFFCKGNEIVQAFDDEGRWRPLNQAEAGQLDFLGGIAGKTNDIESKIHYMGEFSRDDGSTVHCFTGEVFEAPHQFANLRANLGNIDRMLFNLAGRALQICDWYKSHRFCGKCGASTEQHALDRATVCSNCKLHFYPRLSPSIIVLVHREDEVLLGRNHLFPKGLYSTLAGFVEPGESIEETVRREVAEEVGVKVGTLRYRGSQPWPFPNSLMLGFHAEYESGDIVLQADEIADAGWFRCDELPQIPGKFAISRWLIDEYLTGRGFPA